MKNTNVATITLIGLFTAMLAILSPLSIGFNILGVPATLQTFAMALSGFVLGRKNGTIAVVIYVFIGFIGLPVYSGFNAGPSVLFGITGGFLFGFIGLAFLCGLASDTKNIALKIFFPAAGLIFCHIAGILQFSFVADMKIAASAAAISIPYLPKDILSVVLAYIVAKAVKKALFAAKVDV